MKDADDDRVTALADALDAIFDTDDNDGLRPDWWRPHELASAQLIHLRRLRWDLYNIDDAIWSSEFD